MKKRVSWLLGLYSLCVLLAACQSDDEPVVTPPENGDAYEGAFDVITLQDETEDFHYTEFVCTMSAEDGTIISRKGEHTRLGGKSTLTFDVGLKKGVYRLLYLSAPVVESASADTTWAEYGLGCRVEISDVDTMKVLDAYSKAMKLSGSGTEADPFIVSSRDHLKRIRTVTNDQVKNNLLFPQTYFLQVADIDMDQASWESDHEFGWLPIGNLPNNPFRGIYNGNGYAIKNLWSTRPNSAGIALFGYTEKALFQRVRIEDARIEGNYATGTLVGGAVSAGDSRDKTTFLACSTKGGYVKAGEGSMGAGGIVGVVDMYGMIVLDSCRNEGTAVSGDYAIGGLLGAGTIYSQSYLSDCENLGSVTSNYSGAGGLVGSVDSLFVIGCVNKGDIIGAKAYNGSDASNAGYGAGGIAGGTGMSFFYASSNEGNVDGYIGVGGIIGSTRVGSDELMFNNVLTHSCGNSGTITGESAVGGICGESQFGCYSVYNTGGITVSADHSYVGGIVGNTSISVIHNALNSGKVKGESAQCAGGIAGKTSWGVLFASQNFGDLDVSASYAGGLVGLAGNYTMVNYCGNFAEILNKKEGPTGGLIGEIGDLREWSAADIASCVIGACECVMGILGPVISVKGESIEKAIGGKVGEKAAEKIVHCLHIGETVVDAALIKSDEVMFACGLHEMLTEEEFEMLTSSLKIKASNVDQNVKQKMSDIRNGFSLSADLLSNGLNAGTATEFNDHLETLLSFYEASDDNNAIINFNINYKREERYEKLEQEKKTKEIIQKCVAGACIIVGAIATVASAVATAGTTTAFVFTAFASMSSIIGGANAIVEGATDFQNNVVIVSQCVNMGKVSQSHTSSSVGGIVGHMQQHVLVKDCLSAGPCANSSNNAAGISGEVDSRAEISRCLTVGSGWYYPIFSNSATFPSFNDNYCYDATAVMDDYSTVPLSLEEMSKKESYGVWDINGSHSTWKLTEQQGYFPVPYHSEMEEEIEE